MKFLKKLKLGNLELPSNVWCAPLAGCSDWPFRSMTKLYKPGLLFCEMVKMDALVRHEGSTFRILDYTKDMHPIGAQLCGAKLHYAAQSAKVIEDLGFDVLDLNCGCPVDKVTKDGSGSGLLKNPELIGQILYEMVKSVQIPVTVKIRIGWDEDNINATDIVKIAEQAGAKAITVHGRTRKQSYRGKACRNTIAECKKAAKEILVIGNGDIFSAESALDMFEQTACDGILIARGTMGCPWIVEDVARALEGLPPILRTPQIIKDHLLRHMDQICQYQTPRKRLLDLRRVGCYYLKNVIGAKPLREAINKAESWEKAVLDIQGFCFDDLMLITDREIEQEQEASCES